MNRLLTPEERTWLANYLRENTLPVVNATDKKVVPKQTFYAKYGKRMIDIVLSLIGFSITLPVNIALGICTYFDVGRPIFFFQKRPGKDGKQFTIIKFRNMRNAKDENGVDLPISQRVTKFGSFVRRTSLDELLNFVSIIKGDMSLIGPRPLATLYMNRYSDRHNARHSVRPGLECPNLKNHGYSRDWHERLENDVWYVENMSFLTDCKMAFMLVNMVLDRKTRNMHAVKGDGDFLGYDAEGHGFGMHEVPEVYMKMLDERRKSQ